MLRETPEDMTDLSTLRVLFIDDHDDMRGMMKLLLARRNYAVETADCAPAALEVAPIFQPHIIVSDIGMPGMDGYELMRRLREDQRLCPFRAVALTGFGLMADKDKARDCGFDECLTKPVNFNLLFDLLEDFRSSLTVEMLTKTPSEMSSIEEPDAERPPARLI